MALVTLIIATGVITAVRGTGHLQCNKPNEEARYMAECPPQKTCRTRNIQVSCLQSATENCENKCVCKDGYYRNSAGECVSSEDCDKCFGQNQYYSCRIKSDKLCSDFKKTDSTSSQSGSINGEVASTKSDPNNDNHDEPVDVDGAVNSSKCKPQCYCDPGTARDENNECVPYDQCNQPCGPGEIKDYCPTDCPYDYCPKNERRSVKCPKPTPCPKPQCKCSFNSRRADNGTCISTRNCPPFECKKPFEIYDPCHPLCPNGSCGQATPTGRCPAIFGRIGIVLECNPQCRCMKGYWWNEAKVCIPYNQCPGKSNNTSTPTQTRIDH